MKCDKCFKDFEEREIQEHHRHPRFMDNPKGNGMKDYLCKGCHDFLHKLMLKWLWDSRDMSKEKSIDYIKKRTQLWITT